MSSAPRCFWRLYVFTRHLYYAGLSELGVPGGAMAPPDFSRSVNPGLFQQGGQIVPTKLPLPPGYFQTFLRPSYVPSAKYLHMLELNVAKLAPIFFAKNLSKSFIKSQGLPWTISIYILTCCIKFPSVGFFPKITDVISEKKVQWYMILKLSLEIWLLSRFKSYLHIRHIS